MEWLIILTAIAILLVVKLLLLISTSKKPAKLIFAIVKYEFWFALNISHSLVQDLLMKRKNKKDFPVKSGKIALITGGTRGIGLEVVKLLLKSDIHVIIGCRNVTIGKSLLKTVRNEGIFTGTIHVFKLDISDTNSVKEFAKNVKENYSKIHYLINCAGIAYVPYQETKDGYEIQFSTNYLGHFLLTHLLLNEIKAAGEENSNARIVNVSSCTHLVGNLDLEDINQKNFYIPRAGYAKSKLAQILFTNYLDRSLKRENTYVQVNAVHPGIVNTNIFAETYLRKMQWIPLLIFKSPDNGALPVVYTCLSPELEGKGGTYINNCVISKTSKEATSIELQKELFEFSKNVFKIDTFGAYC